MRKNSGILLPISSLPSPYGIGTLGKEAKQFIDFLSDTKQTYCQILPIGPTGYGDSPYSSFSSFAGNPYFIDFNDLVKRGYLKKSEFSTIKWSHKTSEVDYERLYRNRFLVLRHTVKRVMRKSKESFESFVEDEKDWLVDYALFMVIKNLCEGKPIEDWPEKFRKWDKKELKRIQEEYKDEIIFYEIIQYLFFTQWKELKEYANQKGIQIIGDLPIYVARDSVEVWSSPHVFQLDEDLRVKKIAGCPPDAYAPDGQLWGNPLYDWKYLKRTKYQWWMKRIHQQLRFYDVLRLDHFRGFESYFVIDAYEETARNGVWKKGPSSHFIQAIRKEFKNISIIAEDLGFLTPEVKQMLKDSTFPGMKVVEFAFDELSLDNDYLPHHYPSNCVAYLGTHDNDTVMGWMKNLSKETYQFAKKYYQVKTKKELYHAMVNSLFESKAKTVIIQLQDYLLLDSKARINTPSTLGGNWLWRMKPNQITSKEKKDIKELTERYHRERK